jgi:hypothetical protein
MADHVTLYWGALCSLVVSWLAYLAMGYQLRHNRWLRQGVVWSISPATRWARLNKILRRYPKFADDRHRPKLLPRVFTFGVVLALGFAALGAWVHFTD